MAKEFITKQKTKFRHNWLYIPWLVCVWLLLAIYEYYDNIGKIVVLLGLFLLSVIICLLICSIFAIPSVWYNMRVKHIVRYEKNCKNCRYYYTIDTLDDITKKVDLEHKCNYWEENKNNVKTKHTLKNFKACKYFKLKKME